MKNFIDDSVKIDFPVPEGFDYYMNLLEKYDDENDYGHYNALCEPFVFSICKNNYADGKITRDQWRAFERRYRL